MIEPPQATPVMPADFYRRHAVRVRRLASETTTPAIKDHLHDVADQYDRLADLVRPPAAPQRETT